MVNKMHVSRSFIARAQAVIAALTLLAPMTTLAAVVASVDRDQVELNESFTYKVTVDTAIDVEPDVSALEKDFYVGTRSQLSNTTIVNGQISRSRTWTYVLMAKQDGMIEIPAIEVAGESSNTVPIIVKPVSSAAPGEADIFVTAEVDFAESYVQAQVLYTLKVYRAVATRQPRLSDPEVSGVDVLVELAGDERSYDALLDGKAYNVVERVYALFPQESGELRIAPVRFEARVLRDGRITGRKVFRSEAATVSVQPIPPAPAAYPDAAWLPARQVGLSEDWSRDVIELPAGEPITRHVTVTALGQLSTQIPAIEPAQSAALKLYPDKPELKDSAVSQGILAERSEQYALIGVQPGPVELPAVELPWWDITANEWKIAELPARTLSILPSNEAQPQQPTPAATAVPAETRYVDDPFWRRVSEGLALLWLITICGWWFSTRQPRREIARVEPEVPLHKQQARLIKKARKGARERDADAVKQALLEWAKLEWPNNAPRSVGSIANRVAAPLREELLALSAASYGPARDANWDGTTLDKALRNVSIVSATANDAAKEVLPPLMPRRSA
ncbi:MAG: protein BatD [Woeseia sp.]|nr:BatD family protein [Woeseia sp.]NNE60273.1 protein BatD [Woeseia sp.]